MARRLKRQTEESNGRAMKPGVRGSAEAQVNSAADVTLAKPLPDVTGLARKSSHFYLKVSCTCALLIILVFSIFGQTLAYEFVNYDDDQNIYGNPMVSKGLSMAGLRWVFTHNHVGHWDPLTVLSHMLDCQLYGLWAGGHHLTNVLLHSASVVLLFILLLQTTKSFLRSAFSAAVWAIHPLRVESVAWVTERKDMLSGLFFMLTLIAYVFYARNTSLRGSKARYCMVGIFLTLGLMSKSMLMSIPFILLLLDYWPLRRWHPRQDDENWRPALRLCMEKIPLLLISITFAIAAIFAGRSQMVSLEKAPLPQRMGDALFTSVAYLYQTIWPADLAVRYMRPANGLPVWQLILAALTWGVVSTWVILRGKKQPWLIVGWFWYLGMLIPVAGFFQSENFPQDDRYTYLPQIGLCVAGTWMAADWAGQEQIRRISLNCVAWAILFALAVAAIRQTTYWRDSITLWAHTVECTKNDTLAHVNLGNALLDQQRTGEAIVQYDQALALDPGFAMAYYDLANVTLAQGRTDEAISLFRQALRANPTLPAAHVNLGNLLLQKGLTEEAITHLRQALEINPGPADVQINLANALALQGRVDEAIIQYHQVLDLNPLNSDAFNGLGYALLRQGRIDEAIVQFQQSLLINPGDANTQSNIADALLRQGRTEDAIAHTRKALELRPLDANALNRLAWMLATAPQSTLRDGAQALGLAIRTNQLTGGDKPEALRTLAAAYAETGQFPSALQTAQKALQLAETKPDAVLADELRQEIKSYAAGQSFRDAQK